MNKVIEEKKGRLVASYKLVAELRGRCDEKPAAMTECGMELRQCIKLASFQEMSYKNCSIKALGMAATLSVTHCRGEVFNAKECAPIGKVTTSHK